MHITDHIDEIRPLLERAVEERQIPGGSIAVGIGESTVLEYAVGYAENYDDIQRPMTIETIFDLASLTKVVATLPSILHLVDMGQLSFMDPVVKFLPKFQGTAKEQVTVWHLLTHLSGLPAEREYYKKYSGQEIIEAAYQEPLEIQAGQKVVYSDIGYILLGEIVRVISGFNVHQYSETFIFRQLNMIDTRYCPDSTLFPRTAATEVVGRGFAKVGVVHDENAEGLGGVSGHAGLFAPLRDLERYVKAWINPRSGFLSPKVRDVAVKLHTANVGGFRGLGWALRHDSYDHTGDLWPETTAGHTGYTGTSITFDPASGLWAIILTNRVHYGRGKNISRLRGLIHNVIQASIVE